MYRFNQGALEVKNPKNNKWLKAQKIVKKTGNVSMSSSYYRLVKSGLVEPYKEKQKTFIINIRALVVEGKTEVIRPKHFTINNVKLSKLQAKDNTFMAKKVRELATNWIDTLISKHKYEYNVELKNIVSFKVLPFINKKMKNIKMKATTLVYKLLGDTGSLSFGKDQCVIDYIYMQLKGVESFKTLTIDKLKLDFPFYKNGISTRDIIEWAKSRRYISVYALNPLMKVFENYIADDSQHALVFIVNNKHCYPIMDAKLRQMVFKSKEISLGSYTYFINQDEDYYFADLTKIDYKQLISGTIGESKKLILIDTHVEGGNKLMADVLNDVVKYTGCVVENIHFGSNNEVIAFIHPINNIIYLDSPEYQKRKTIMETLYSKLGIEELKFRNQSFSVIAENIIKYILLKSPENSEYNHQVQSIIDTYKPKPIVAQFQAYPSLPENGFAFDIKKSYSKFLRDNTYDYPIFTVCDEVKPFDRKMKSIDVGLYYIDKTIYLTSDKTVFLDKGFYTHMTIDKALKRGCLQRSDIKYYIQAGHHHSGNYFKDFIDFTFKTFEPDIAKSIVNSFTGCLGIRNDTKCRGCITDDWDTACALVIGESLKNRESKAIPLNDYYFVRSQAKSRKMNDRVPFYMMVIEGGVWNVVDLHDEIFEKNVSQVAYINTDAIGVINPKQNILKTLQPDVYADSFVGSIFDKHNTPETEMIGGLKLEAWKPKGKLPVYDVNPVYNLETNSWNVYNEASDFNQYLSDLKAKESFFIQGDGGCGKSYTVVEMMKQMPNKKFTPLTFTNKAAVELRIKGALDCLTLDLFFMKVAKKEGWEKLINSLKNTYAIVIDEFSMIPLRMLAKLLRIKKELPGINFWILGDKKQLKPVITDKSKSYKYHESIVMKYLCNFNYIEARYKPNCGRYDAKTYQILTHFVNHSSLPEMNKSLKPGLMMNLSYKVATCERVNNECRELFIKNNPNAIKINNKFYVGMRIISNINDKQFGIFNSETYIIQDYKDKIVHIESYGKIIQIPVDMLTYKFDLAYCITIHRCQGSTIYDEFNIHDINILSKELMYVALSRCKDIDCVHFDFTGRVFYQEKPIIWSVNRSGKELQTGEEFKNGTIYGIYHNNKLQYIGQTVHPLEKRLKEHINSNENDTFHTYIRASKKSNFEIKLIKLFPCTSVYELMAEETRQIHFHSDDNELLNTRQVPKKSNKVSTIAQERLLSVRQQYINDNIKIKDRTAEGYLQLIYKDNENKIKYFKCRYGIRKTKDEAYIEINKKKNELIGNLFIQ
jgi:hypothetical protein